jgi:hypothetical protein
MKSKIILILILSSNLTFTYAQTCCSGGIPLSNSIGITSAAKGVFQLGIQYDYNNLNTLNFESRKLNDNSRLRITHSILINADYAISDKFSVEGLFTWVNQRRLISQFGNENLDVTSGIGDAVILFKYNLKDILAKNSSLNLGIGAKVPLGSSTKKSSQNITLNADLQPGSNAWDIIYWSLFSKTFNFRPTFNAFTRFIYRQTGVNKSYFGDSTYEFGDEFQFFIGISDQFSALKTKVFPGISFKYRKSQQDKIGGFDIENTGGHWVTVMPSFGINITPNLIYSAKAEIPIYSFVEGTQLTPTYRLTTGLLLKITPKTKVINLK